MEGGLCILASLLRGQETLQGRYLFGSRSHLFGHGFTFLGPAGMAAAQ